MLVRRDSGATGTEKRIVSATFRVSFTRNGIPVAARVATSTRKSPPFAQKTSERESGVHAIPG